MKLVRLYSNRPSVFIPIRFNGVVDANLSVIFARITRPKDARRDSHNLGKTTLISLIDFLLLKDVSESNCFLIKHVDRFLDFVFFMEVLAPDGGFVTIRRSVEAPTRISLKRHATDTPDLTLAGKDDWDHFDTAIDTARQLLDSYLNLSVISPWGYRKGVSYFLRTQADYHDYFQISKFQKGQDSQWKPYLAHLLGLNAQDIERKYELDATIEELERRKEERQAEVQIEEADFSLFTAQLEVKKNEVAMLSEQLESFDFSQEESRVNKEVVDAVERNISTLNDQIYKHSYDISQMQEALAQKVEFRIDAVKQIYEETSTYLPPELLRDYSELVSFNKKLTHERNVLLRQQVKALEAEVAEMRGQLADLNAKRVEFLRVLRNADTFKKFKGLQRILSQNQAEVAYMEGQIERLGRVRELARQIRTVEVDRQELINQITTDVESPASVSKRISVEFHSLVRRVLDLDGQFYVTLNRSSNLEFKIDTKLSTKSASVSSQSEGTSYKKLLCALFDIALLEVMADKPFYHFVYHDGILEGLDTRKRRVLLTLLREISDKYKIQYILSAIDSDLPRDEKDNKIEFSAQEIILELSDQGAKGRLFRMEEF
jgi:uncharacterized protein YydD (DUF2326 family)